MYIAEFPTSCSRLGRVEFISSYSQLLRGAKAETQGRNLQKEAQTNAAYRITGSIYSAGFLT